MTININIVMNVDSLNKVIVINKTMAMVIILSVIIIGIVVVNVVITIIHEIINHMENPRIKKLKQIFFRVLKIIVIDME
jgi:hypothetical protein